jgi:hypothetical protein
MPACPVCRDEFEDHVTVCPTDDAVLVPRGQLPPPPVSEAALGLFDRRITGVVLGFLQHKKIPVRVIEVDADRIEIRVPQPVRDGMRAELTLAWDGFLRMIEPEERMGVAALGGPQPGWLDAPQGVWVDREGQLRVEASPDEEATADASRTVGPTLAVSGLIALLLAWVTGWPEVLTLAGGSAVVLGVLLPR